ncbi:MAG: COG1470 family protein, partial [Polaromonas sp.]
MKGWCWTLFPRQTAAAAVALAMMSPLPSALAAEFAVSASPPRFELTLKPGERSRQVLEITNASAQATTLGIKTADWTLGADNSVAFHEELQPGSCRPWVALERRELSVSSGRPYRFRFEIAPPADAKPGECRFAIMLEGQEQVGHAAGGLDFPFSARLGVVVYVALGGAAPELSVVGSGVQNVNGKPTPVLQVRNSGAAHGRLAGFLSGTDAANTELEFAPASMPILPGETRGIALTATRPGDPDTQVQVQFPVTISGK